MPIRKDKSFSRLAAALLGAAALCSCSVLAYVPEGEYALSRNRIEVDGHLSLKNRNLTQYLAQQQTPFMVFGGEPVIFNEDAVHISEENLKSHMQYLGYYGSKVSSEVRKRGRKAKVKYMVTPGKRFTISSITYDLPNDPDFEEIFYADTSHTIVRSGYILSEQRLSTESERCASYLRTKGYYSLTGRNFFFEADTLDADDVSLKISVRPYGRDDSPAAAKPLTQYHIGDVRIARDEDLAFRDKVLLDLNTIHPGSLYDETVINTSYQRLSNIRTFSSVSIALSERPDTALVDCDISLSKSKLQGFKANLEASLNSSGLIGISPQLTYFHRNIFHGGEMLNLGFMGNFQFRPDSDVRADEYGISMGLTFPKFIGLPQRLFEGASIPATEIKASFNYQDRPEYVRTIISTSYGYSGILRSHFSYQLYPLQINMVKLDNLDAAFSATLARNPYMRYAYQNHFDAGVGGMLYYASDMSLNPSGSYHYSRLTLDMSGNVISLFHKNLNKGNDGEGLILGTPYAQYVRGEVTLGNTWRFGRDGRFALAGRVQAGAGYAYHNSTALPYEKQFYCGGANSMRGWQARSVGPGDEDMDNGFIIPSQTGDLKLEANAEFRFRMFWKLEGALFADVGNVWNISAITSPTYLFDTLAADWGTGIRADLTFIVIRIDAGFKVYDPAKSLSVHWCDPSQWLRKNGFALHFGVGYPF